MFASQPSIRRTDAPGAAVIEDVQQDAHALAPHFLCRLHERRQRRRDIFGHAQSVYGDDRHVLGDSLSPVLKSFHRGDGRGVGQHEKSRELRAAVDHSAHAVIALFHIKAAARLRDERRIVLNAVVFQRSPVAVEAQLAHRAVAAARHYRRNAPVAELYEHFNSPVGRHIVVYRNGGIIVLPEIAEAVCVGAADIRHAHE